MQLRAGLALSSAVDTTQVIVTKCSSEDVDLTCGGVAMVPKGGASHTQEGDPGHMKGTVLGKRYVDAAGRIEVLCTKAGEASLGLAGELLVTAEAKPLPASD